MEGGITEQDLYESLSALPNNKTPGTDGLTVEFYKAFWDILKKPLCKCVKAIYDKGELSEDQKRGVINLLPKPDKDIRAIKNWRPISILNVDYKLITKTLADRLKLVLPDIIHPDQCGYVRDRKIGENIRIVHDLIHYCNDHDVEGLLVFLDFEKAFDSVSWEFINHTLTEFGLGSVFKKWINILYNDINSSVINKGHMSQTFKLKRGIRQGCPISAYIFILCAELLAQKLRANADIHGLNIGETEFKLLQFADDTVLILKDTSSLKFSLDILKDFATVSGLRLNKSKTEVFNLGKGIEINGLSKLGFKVTTEPIRYLGIWFEKDIISMEYKNFRHKLEKIRNILKLWLQRDLSLKGKITVIKALAMSQLIFSLTMLVAPKWVIEEANTLFYKFLWGGKPDKVKRTTIMRQIQDGGLKMPDIDTMARALKIGWIKKLFEDQSRKWTIIPSTYFSYINFTDFCKSNYSTEFIPLNVPGFYSQSLWALREVVPREVTETSEIINQSLWFNRNITQNSYPMFNRDWYTKGIKTIADIIDENGDFLSSEKLKEKFNICSTNFLEYLGLRHAIPFEWKKKIQATKPNLTDLYTTVMLRCNGKMLELKHTVTKMLYWELLKTKCNMEVTGIMYWVNAGLTTPQDMAKYYMIPFASTTECKVQSLQYKILHTFYPCRLKLKQWKIKESDQCLYCEEPDNLLHHFARCPQIIYFWDSFANWWSTLCGSCDSLSEIDIMLGRQGSKCHTIQLNFAILYAKWYIYKTKYLEEECFFLLFLPDFKTRLQVEERVYSNQGKYGIFIDRWYEILSNM